MRPPRMTLQRWMITIALAALLLGLAVESRRSVDGHRGPGYHRARAVFAARQAGRNPGASPTGDPYLVLGFAATALLGCHLRRRFPRDR